MNDPHLEERHRELATRARDFGERHLRAVARSEEDPAGSAAEVAAQLAGAGLLQAVVPPRFGSADARSIAVLRERLAYFSLAAESVLSAHGLAAHLLSSAGNEAQRARWMPRPRRRARPRPPGSWPPTPRRASSTGRCGFTGPPAS